MAKKDKVVTPRRAAELRRRRLIEANTNTELRPVMVRMPEFLRQQLEDLARDNGRSMNSLIIQLLKYAIRFVDPSAEIPGEGRGHLHGRTGGGSELILTLGGRPYVFVSEDTIQEIIDSGSAPKKMETEK